MLLRDKSVRLKFGRIPDTNELLVHVINYLRYMNGSRASVFLTHSDYPCGYGLVNSPSMQEQHQHGTKQIALTLPVCHTDALCSSFQGLITTTSFYSSSHNQGVN